MYNELRATKVLVEIPKLQQKMTKYDLRGVDFVQFAKVLNQINKEIRQDLQKINPSLITEDSDEDFESPRRHKSVQPQQKLAKPLKVSNNFHARSTHDDLFSHNQSDSKYES